jgi:hypothetical protein
VTPAGATRNLRGLSRASHKRRSRAPNSRASPFLLSTYAPCACHSNRYYIRNTLTSYQKRGKIDRELWPPARFCFPFWNPAATCPSHPTSPRNSLRTLSLFVSPIFFPSALVCPQRRRLAATCFYTKPPFGIFSFFLFDSTLSTVDLSFLLSATVHINIIPRILAFLCFHTLTNSFASRKTLSPIVSSPSELFAQNTRGGGTPSNPNSSPSVVQLLTIHYYSLLLTTLCYPLYNPHLQKHREGDTLQPSNAHTLPRMAPVTSHQSPNSDFEDYRQDQRPLGGLLINVPL